ncbi:sporulation integral membrane protein YtvI [Velocimicrobium porci]|uniref:Sporulation integral membrane protein YtvI n=1 Tax=Velocimicrobium porci TaxID=2606634 RepID=A0A6L5XVR1_9FIRM|nr:sporulation integral membrane protein YtvI [Velocimicrobium porci]MSS62674.1 sporulation integral membrane protein YtvI [Velocimicrobium porci]
MGNSSIYKKILVDFLIAVITVLILVFLVPKAIRFFMPFVIGWIIAMIANPLVRFLERRVKIVRKHSSVLIIIAALGAVVAILYFGGIFLVRQTMGLISDLPYIADEIQNQIIIATNDMKGFYHILPENLKEWIDSIGGNLGKYITTFVSKISTTSINGAGLLVKNVAEGFLMAIITILSAYFFIAERDILVADIKKNMPESIMEKYRIIKVNFVLAIGGYFKAQFKIMGVIIVILFVGLEIMDVNYSFLLALLIAFLDFLPVFGTGTVIFPWALFDVIGGKYFHAVCLMIIYIICQLVRQVLQPKMVGDSIGLSPLATLVFMYVGYKIKGVLGMIIGIPVGMAIINLYKAGIFDQLIRGAKIIIHDINEYRKY